ncbi:MAG: hypothetical protein KAS95_02310 [Candidatus Heimdallarchaeota archaeon]|nr:hypothetical protein [Candidatus Heimdallarchaeota archaeon]
MSEEEAKNCSNCGTPMLKRHDYLPDDFDLKEVKDFWLCGSCMLYELIE